MLSSENMWLPSVHSFIKCLRPFCRFLEISYLLRFNFKGHFKSTNLISYIHIDTPGLHHIDWVVELADFEQVIIRINRFRLHIFAHF